MGNRIKVTPDELRSQGQKLANLADEYESLYKKADAAIKKIKNASSKKLVTNLLGKTTQLNLYFSCLNDTLRKGAQVAVQSADTYENVDTILRDKLRHSFSDEVINSKPSTQIVEEDYNELQARKMEEMYSKNQRIDTSTMDHYIAYTNAAGTRIGYYESGNGCTWYAAARYRQVNGIENELKFSQRGGNADNWVNSIDRSVFNVNSSSDADVIKCNTIAVSTEYDSYREGIRASGCHVAYVEAVKDGYVYYTDGSYGSAESSWGYVQKVPIETFKADYEYIISAK